MQDNTIGQRLYRLRREKNLSQQQLAVAVGVSRQTVYKWESGGAIPSADNIGYLSVVLGVSSDYFISTVVGDTCDSKATVCADGGDEAAKEECAACVGKKKSLLYKILIAATAIGFCACLLFAVITGCISLSSNTGDRVISTVTVDRSVFIVLAVGTGMLFIALITEICVYLVKIR